MSEENQVEVTRRVVVEEKSDSVTRWLVWGAAFLALSLVALIAYGIISGAFSSDVPRTAEEYQLAITAEAIAKDPSNGLPYAQRAEALYKLGRVDEAFEVLDQGEKAVGEKTPDVLFVLRTRIMLLNEEQRFEDAAKVGARAIDLNDAYLAEQIESNTAKGIVSAVGTVDMRAGVEIALQYANALAAQEKWEESLKLYNYALAWEPTAADILSLRGTAYLRMGSDTSATADFKEVLRFLPDDPTALEGLKEIESK